MKYVINSSNEACGYAFFLPIVNTLWKKYMGYETISLLVGNEQIWTNKPHRAFIYKHIVRTSTKVHHINNVENFKTSTVSQVSRLVAACLPGYDENDYMLTSDVDMFPLNKDYFHQQDKSKKVHLFNADAYADITKGLKPPKFPICYIGTKVKTWKEIMGMDTNDINEEIRKIFKGRKDNWYIDEDQFNRQIKKNPVYPNDCQMLVRGGFAQYSRAARRLDRDAWSFKGEGNLIDCHSMRPGYRHKGSLMPVFNKYCNPEDAAWFNKYFDKFSSIGGKQ